MSKITFLGAGSTVFAKNVLGDCMTVDALQDFEFALFDIDHDRLKDSERMLTNMKQNLGSTVNIVAYTDRKEALRDANYVIIDQKSTRLNSSHVTISYVVLCMNNKILNH